jgi:predicted metal-dependent phosphotriesterase family hydrolase
MLRASSVQTGEDFDVSALTSDEGQSVGIANEEVLDHFTDAALHRDEKRLAEAREALKMAMGADALVDAAAVIGCFQRLNRMADGTGIALDEQMLIMTAGLREELSIDGYATAANTPKLRGMKKIRATLMRPLEGLMMRAMQKGIQKAQAKKST